jgi:hypothetical protein
MLPCSHVTKVSLQGHITTVLVLALELLVPELSIGCAPAPRSAAAAPAARVYTTRSSSGCGGASTCCTGTRERSPWSCRVHIFRHLPTLFSSHLPTHLPPVANLSLLIERTRLALCLCCSNPAFCLVAPSVHTHMLEPRALCLESAVPSLLLCSRILYF